MGDQKYGVSEGGGGYIIGGIEVIKNFKESVISGNIMNT